jgi:hypothetical protein
MAAESGQISLRFGISSQDEADRLAKELESEGVSAGVDNTDVGLFPVAVLLAIFIPPGLALLARTVDRIIHGWKDHGVLIDARGTGAPVIIESPALPYGVVEILTRAGEKVQHELLPEEDLGKYVAGAAGALAEGASASDADKKGTEESTDASNSKDDSIEG